VTANPKKLKDLELARMVLTFNLLSRQFAVQQQNIDPEGRNLDKDCGYPQGRIDLRTYRDMYDRWGIAARVVQVYPDECWATEPEVYESEDPKKKTRWERKLQEVLVKHKLWHYVHRADVECGIGSFGGLLMGFPGDPETPVPGVEDYLVRGARGAVEEQPLYYLRPLPEDYLRVEEFDTTDGPRFGQPLYYTMTTGFAATAAERGTNPLQVMQEPEAKRIRLHWTRVVHLADGLESSDVFGTPRMQRVFNYLFDVRKIGGGSAEMFWQGAFPGWAFEVFKELADSITLDRETIAEEVEKYRNRLQRVLTSKAGTWKSLAPQIADPSNHLLQQLTLLCASLGVPLRIFLGSEAGHLASTQDIQTWNRRLGKRQNNYLTPWVVRPVIDRLIAAGVLPPPRRGPGGYRVSWKDLNSLTDTDKADRSVKLAQSLLQYVTSGAFKMIGPIDFLVSFLQFTPDEAGSMIAAMGGEIKVLSDLQAQADAMNAPQGDPAKATGASGRRNGQGTGA
jgi:hypothetical protein